MFSFYKKYARTGLDLALLAVSIISLLTLISWMYQLAAPLFFAAVWFAIIEPLAFQIHKGGLHKGFAALLSVWVWLLLMLGVFSFFAYLIVNQTQQIIEQFPAMENQFIDKFSDMNFYLQEQLTSFGPDWTLKLQGYVVSLLNNISNWVTTIFLSMVQTVKKVPILLINSIIGLILAYFLSLERNQWSKWIHHKAPQGLKDAGSFLYKHVWSGLRRYIRAQLILVSCTFSILLVGLLILGSDKALSLALFCAILDLFPLIGVATLFIPWMLYSWATGNVTFAVGLLILYGVVVLFRQIAEPKLSGESLGVSAFTMLASLMISFSIFGVAGMVATPVLILFLKAMYEQGIWKKWIHWPEPETIEEIES